MSAVDIIFTVGVVVGMTFISIMTFRTLWGGKSKSENSVVATPSFSHDKIIIKGESLRIAKRGDVKYFWGTLELYEKGIIIRRGFLMENEEVFAVEKRDIIEVGIPRFSELWFLGGRNIRWFYIEYQNDIRKNKRFYVASASWKHLFKLKTWREEWLQAFRLIGVPVRTKK